MEWVVFMEGIFSCLNLKRDVGFLPYSMPEVFNKTGHGLTDVLYLPELNLNQCFTQRFLDRTLHTSTEY